jgi:hypothetical protein
VPCDAITFDEAPAVEKDCWIAQLSYAEANLQPAATLVDLFGRESVVLRRDPSPDASPLRPQNYGAANEQHHSNLARWVKLYTCR